MKKVTDLKENEVIHVRTEEEDLDIRTLMHEAGLRWCTGDSYLELSGILLGGGKYFRPSGGVNGHIGSAKSAGYTIYPASDFLEPSIGDLAEQLKKIAESKGMKAEIALSKIDIWDGVEFCKHVSGKHYKIDRIENQYIFTSGGSILIDANCEPVSEETYVNWLKSEVVRRFGDIKVGDRFIEPSGTEWAMRPNFMVDYEEWHYEKGSDELFCYALLVYRKGKWAERVRGKLTGSFVNYHLIFPNETGSTLGFSFKGFTDDEGILPIDKLQATGEYLAKKLEKFLNKE